MSIPCLRVLFSLTALLALLATGCGERTEKVDLNAQLGALGGDAEAKVNALTEIAKLGPAAAPAVDRLIPLLKDEDDAVRRTAAWVLGTIGPEAKAALPELKQLLQTSDRNQMTAVANAINAIETPKAGEAIRIENTSN
jgi:HEAT repeat protein